MEYKLEGLDKEWLVASASYEAAYSKLPAGTYVFKVRVMARGKNWQSAERHVTLVVKAPFYKTIWFSLLITLLVLGLLYFWYRERLDHQAKLFTAENQAQLLAKEKTKVQYENLKQHLNPHFLFNSLSSLSSLIEIDPKMAGRFLGSLSKIYRYILQSKDKDTVALKDEITFVQSFIALQQTRFEQGLQVNINIDESNFQKHIVPVTLQNLIENAIKHNIIDDENILVIDIFAETDYLVVKNKMQLKKFVETSNNQGLENLKYLYSFLSDRPLQYGREAAYFLVKIPLL
jgi:LytS/YehU family sensor histidine kinase